MNLPDQLHARRELNDEVHARPPELLRAPVSIIYIAMLSGTDQIQDEINHVARICRMHGVAPPVPPTNHFVANLGLIRLKWERHTEFSRYHIMYQADPSAPFSGTIPKGLPDDLISGLPGQLLVATRVAMIAANQSDFDPDAIASEHFGGNILIGSAVSGGKGIALADFRIRPDGMSRMLMLDLGMAPAQAGRIAQRLLEIDTYRMMALLTLPVARACGPLLAESGGELADITTRLAASDSAGQAVLLERLMKLEAQIETKFASTQYRFSAAVAYYELVRSHIEELREQRIEGLQTFEEFTERRLAPAMSTCASVSQRLNALSARVARSTQLLATQLAVYRDRQNQALLETMARRAKLQLRLQQTVEGLSVAAITYYLVGLVGYAAKGVSAVGLKLNAELVTGLAIPIVAALVAYGVKGLRRKLGLSDRSANLD